MVRPLNRRRVISIVVGLLAVAALFLLVRPSTPAPDDGSAATSRSTLGNVDGIELDGFDDPEPVVLAAFKGKPLVVNYWASWCLFCIEEMPDFQAVYEDVRDDVAFLGVNIQDDTKNAKEFLEIAKVNYPLASDPDGKIYQSLKGVSMPTTIFIDERGEIVERYSGPLTKKQLRERIRKHFSI